MDKHEIALRMLAEVTTDDMDYLDIGPITIQEARDISTRTIGEWMVSQKFRESLPTRILNRDWRFE